MFVPQVHTICLYQHCHDWSQTLLASVPLRRQSTGGKKQRKEERKQAAAAAAATAGVAAEMGNKSSSSDGDGEEEADTVESGLMLDDGMTVREVNESVHS